MNILGLTITRTNSKNRTTELDGVRLTPAQQLALLQAEHAADQMMQAIYWAKRLAWLILGIVMVVSYEDQRGYLDRIGMSHLASSLIPFAFDAATVLCVMVIGVGAMKRSAKIIALTVVLFPVGASAFINVQASPTAAVAIVYVLVVALIPAIELIKAFMGADFGRMLNAEAHLMGAARPKTPAAASRTLTDEQKEWNRQMGAWTRYQKMSDSARAKYRRDHGGAPAKPVKGQTVRVPQPPAAAPVSPGVGPVGPYAGRTA